MGNAAEISYGKIPSCGTGDERTSSPLLAEMGFLTKEQVATELGVSMRTMDRWEVERMGPPRVQIGRKILYRRVSLIQWLESREQPHNRKRLR